MKAMVYEEYGAPDVLELREIDRPPVTDDGVLVRVHATSVNPVDWHMLTGLPRIARLGGGLRRPKLRVLGVDFAGTVEVVGPGVTQFRPGDEVFGARNGSLAEYVCVRESRAIVTKPANVSFEQAAAAPLAAITALQALRDKGKVRAGDDVLVNGASGGVGTFAVQIAKSFGANVTGVCSPQNVETARSLGADRVIDYTQEDFTRSGQRYDLMIDIAGNRSWSECKRVLGEAATLVIVGGPKTNSWIGPMGDALGRRVVTLIGSRNAVFFLAKLNKQDLLVLSELLESGQVTPVIDRQYPLAETPDAFRYLGEGHARGKVVVTL
jgi:NADPH:quinone reductase-like Zn-dependent oxidoreductase